MPTLIGGDDVVLFRADVARIHAAHRISADIRLHFGVQIRKTIIIEHAPERRSLTDADKAMHFMSVLLGGKSVVLEMRAGFDTRDEVLTARVGVAAKAPPPEARWVSREVQKQLVDAGRLLSLPTFFDYDVTLLTDVLNGPQRHREHVA